MSETQTIGLAAVLSAKAKDRRIRKGLDAEHNLTVTLGRKPTRAELLAQVTAELNAMFGKKL